MPLKKSDGSVPQSEAEKTINAFVRQKGILEKAIDTVFQERLQDITYKQALGEANEIIRNTSRKWWNFEEEKRQFTVENNELKRQIADLKGKKAVVHLTREIERLKKESSDQAEILLNLHAINTNVSDCRRLVSQDITKLNDQTLNSHSNVMRQLERLETIEAGIQLIHKRLTESAERAKPEKKTARPKRATGVKKTKTVKRAKKGRKTVGKNVWMRPWASSEEKPKERKRAVTDKKTKKS